jgi:hypothetical protein
MAVFPIFTKEATEEAKKKMHPQYSKSVWMETRTISGVGYGTDMLDAAASIYNATLE